MEAIIPTEIGIPTLRIEILEKAKVEAVTKDLDMTDELREAVAVGITSYQLRYKAACIPSRRPSLEKGL